MLTPDTNLDHPNKGGIEKKKAVIHMSKIMRIVRLAVKISSTQNGLDSAIYLLMLMAINVQIDVSRSIVLVTPMIWHATLPSSHVLPMVVTTMEMLPIAAYSKSDKARLAIK